MFARLPDLLVQDRQLPLIRGELLPCTTDFARQRFRRGAAKKPPALDEGRWIHRISEDRGRKSRRVTAKRAGCGIEMRGLRLRRPDARLNALAHEHADDL